MISKEQKEAYDILEKRLKQKEVSDKKEAVRENPWPG